MAESGDDEPCLHRTGDAGTVVIGTKGENIAGSADQEEQGDRFEEGFEGLFIRAGGDVTGTVRLFGLGCRDRVVLSDEEAGDVVDGVAVDEGLEKVCAGCEQGEEADYGKFRFVVFGEFEQGWENALAGLGIG